MTVEIRLFASFREFLPEGASGFSFTREIAGAMTAGKIIEELKLSPDVPKLIIVNGVLAGTDRVLEDGDVVSLFPPVSGG